MRPLNQINLVVVIIFALAAAAHGDGIIPTGSMVDPRWNHTATRLLDGRVLVVAGDDDNGPTASAELYNPVTGAWTAASSLASPREYHTATLLPDGKVLIWGGFDVTAYGPFGDVPAIYDPTNGTWTPNGGILQDGLAHHTATLLPNGKVLIVGGVGNHFYGPYGNAFLYDPASNSTSNTGGLGAARMDHTATLLPNGKVLVQGGGTNSAELYNPTNGTWTFTGSPVFPGDTATLLPNGKVLVQGGSTNSAELYDPATGTWSLTGSHAHGENIATLLPNGKVLVVGGYFDEFYQGLLPSAELYDPATGTWSTTTSPLGSYTFGATATLLSNGRVLFVLGGADLYESSLNPIVNLTKLGDGSIQFGFSNPSGASYHVLASPDMAAPLNSWSALGAATETPPGSGQFQFTDHQAPNFPQRFYRVSSP